jgi:serine protease Do
MRFNWTKALADHFPAFDGLLGKRILQGLVLILATLLMYGTVLSLQPDHYSLFRLLWRVPATAEQLAVLEDSKATPARPDKLRRYEVPSLARMDEEYRRVVAHVMPAVVSIDIAESAQEPSYRLKEYRRGKIRAPNGQEREVWIPEKWEIEDLNFTQEIPGVGSGVFLSEDGEIVTNHHVVLDADHIRVTTHDKQVYEAELIGADSTADVAILRVKDARGRKFPVLNFTDSERLRTGQIVFAFGNPFGLAESVTQGVVNGTGRRFAADVANEYIQTDAVINPGNSGGPLTNIYGEAVGINVIAYAADGSRSAARAWQGIGLALPANRVLGSYARLMKLGTRERPYLGVLFNRLRPEKAASLHFEGKNGVLIYSVEQDSPGRALLKQGDIVMEIGGIPVGEVTEATHALQCQKAGAPVEIVVWREGKELRLQVPLGHVTDVNQIAMVPEVLRRKLKAEELKKELKLVLRELTEGDRRETGMPDDLGGIFIFGVDENSGLTGHFERYDLVHEINGTPVWTEKEFYALLASLPADRPSQIVLTRNRRRYFVQFDPVPVPGKP